MSYSRHTRLSTTRAAMAPDVRALEIGYSNKYRLPLHKHDWHQLVYAAEGVLSVYSQRAAWVVPPERAVWMMAGQEHEVEMWGQVRMRTLYFSPDLAGMLPEATGVIQVGPLLRELINTACRLEGLRARVPAEKHLINVLLDQLSDLHTASLELSMPHDERAAHVAEALRDDPAGTTPLSVLAARAGASRRTIERLFRRETSMTLGRWRQQLRLLHALRLLASGESVTAAALDVGYQSPSAFIAMCKRRLGITPSRYHAVPRLPE